MKFRRLNSFQIIVIAVLTLTIFVFACSRKESEQDRKITIGFAPMNVEMTWMKFAYHAMDLRITINLLQPSKQLGDLIT